MEDALSALKLVFIGGDGLEVPTRHHDRIVQLGYVPVQDKYDAYSAAMALCVPSVAESFSIVMMESWLARRPVIVNESCDVTTEYCRLSNGGLYFRDYADFRGILEQLLTKPGLAEALGRQGEWFVRASFSPDEVARKYIDAFKAWELL